MNMNKDILQGKWLEIKGSVKGNWGRLTDNDLGEIAGKGEILLGLLQKKLWQLHLLLATGRLCWQRSKRVK
jgi:uncharacterized protein YjbJ (UPF0337 family)